MRTRVLAPVLLVAAGLAVACVIRLAAQQQQPPGTFRAQVTLVPVDVRVVDRDGKPVTDLKAEDFIVLENGVRQKIQHFSVQTFAPAPELPLGEEHPLLRKVPKLDLVPQKGRVFLIVLGRGRLQVPAKGVDGALKFVRQQLLPQDYVAVLAYNRATDFTRDHEKVAQVLERFKKGHESIESKMSNQMSGLAAIYGSTRIPANLQKQVDEIFRGPEALGARDVPSGGAGQDPKLAEDQRRITDALQLMDARGGAPDRMNSLEDVITSDWADLPFDEYVSRQAETNQDLGNIYAGIEYLRYLEGEKHLVFLTERGLFLPNTQNDRNLASMANDARVVIDTIQTGGIPAGPMSFGRGPMGPSAPVMPGPTFTERFAIASLRNVSMLTGGLSSINDYADKALARINETTLSEYLIGYYPNDTNFDNRYRRIVVRVNRPGVRVLFRHGYFPTMLVPLDHQAFLTYRRIAAAGNYDREVHDLGLKVTTSVVRDEKKIAQRVAIEFTVDVSKVVFKQVDDRRVASIDISFFCADEHERIIGESWQKFDLRLKEETYQKAIKEGVQYGFNLDIQGEPRFVKVIAYNYEADLVGTAMVKTK